jgi:hypothetical protein
MHVKPVTSIHRPQVRAASCFLGRGIHLIDAENLLGGPNAQAGAIRHLWEVYRYNIPTTANDQYFWASSQRLARNAVGALPAQGLRILVRDGRDGADDALIDIVDLEHLARRFQRLVIASGDGKFADLAIAARAAGLHVHLVTGVSDCARRLNRMATTRARLKLYIADATAHQPTLRAAGPMGHGADPVPA